MDLIVSLCRALASDFRLRVHFAVATCPEIVTGELAERMGVIQPILSAEVRVLADLHLLNTRPSGRFVHVCVTPQDVPQQAVVRGMNAVLLETWKRFDPGNPAHCDVWDWLGIADASMPRTWDAVSAKIVLYLTAYTHLRRLLLIRHLVQCGHANQDQMRDAIGMSDSAVSRQLLKLRRRGLLETVGDGQGQAWQLRASLATPFQRALHQLVLSALRPAG